MKSQNSPAKNGAGILYESDYNMSGSSKISALKITNEAQRQLALQVLRVIYCQEKNWVGDVDKVFEVSDMTHPSVSWFLALSDEEPVGVLRVLYEPPLDLYKEYGFKKLDCPVDVEACVKDLKIAEIGRFAVLPQHRRNVSIVAALMKLAVMDTLERGFTHYITDIFEGEVHSPYQFHTRVMGFIPVATHDVGELNCPNRRITMVLDLADCYHRTKKNGGWIFRALTSDWGEELHKKMENSVPLIRSSQPD